MIFRSETHVFGQSLLFESMLCDSRFSRRERESRTRRRAAKSTREVSAHLSTDSAAARQRGSEREQNKKRRRQESTREVSAYTPILLFTSDVSCNMGSVVAGGVGGGLFRRPFFTQCCPESFWENRGRGWRGFGSALVGNLGVKTVF